MAKKKDKRGQADKQKEIGHFTKGIPTWILTIINRSLDLKKMLKNPKRITWRVLPICVLPDDFFIDKSISKKFFFDQKCRKTDTAYRFMNNDITSRYRRLSDENFKEYSRKLSQLCSEKLSETPRLVTLMMPHMIVTGKVNGIDAKKELIIAGMKPKSVREETKFHFFDEVNPAFNNHYKSRYREELYPINVTVNGINSTVYSRSNSFMLGSVYDFIVTRWYQPGAENYDRPIFYDWCHSRVTETFFDIYKLANNLTSLKPFYPNWGYSDETNDILMSSVMFMEKDVPCVNLVFFGPPRCGKTRTLDVFASIFKEDVQSGSRQTVRGIVGSFKDEMSIGAMMGSNYVFLGDEFFRTELGNDKNKKLDAQHIDFIMSKTMELLEHSDKMASSGNFNRSAFFDKSFLAVNNMRDLNAFNQSFSNDPASFMRYSFMTMEQDEIDRIRGSYISPTMYLKVFRDNINKVGFNLGMTAKLYRLWRNLLPMVKVPDGVFFKALEQTNFVHPEYDKREKLMSLIKARTIMNYTINNINAFPLTKSISPTQQDIDEAVRFCNRLSNGFKNVVGLP